MSRNDDQKAKRKTRDQKNKIEKENYKNSFIETISISLDSEIEMAKKAQALLENSNDEKQKEKAQAIKSTAENREKHIDTLSGLDKIQTDMARYLDIPDDIVKEIVNDVYCSEKFKLFLTGLSKKNKDAFLEACLDSDKRSARHIHYWSQLFVVHSDNDIDPNDMAKWLNKNNWLHLPNQEDNPNQSGRRQSDMCRKMFERLAIISFEKSGQRIVNVTVDQNNKIKKRLDKLFE